MQMEKTGGSSILHMQIAKRQHLCSAVPAKSGTILNVSKTPQNTLIHKRHGFAIHVYKKTPFLGTHF